MGREFFDSRHKLHKLDETVCLYRGVPYRVSCNSGKLQAHRVYLYPLGDDAYNEEKRIEVDYREDDFSYKATPLGYTNYNFNALYVIRHPCRITTQGLSSAVLATVSDENAVFNARKWLYSKAAENTILGKYPSLQESLDLIREIQPIRSIAFDRNVAIAKSRGKNLSLMFKGRVCGSRLSTEKAFRLFPGGDYNYLLRYMQRNGVPVL